MENDFVHLHVHSEYSLLDGINKVSNYPQHAKRNGMQAISITDHGNVAGSYRFWKQCKSDGIKPIIGMEAYYTIGDRTIREVDELGEPYYHLVLLALNNDGLHDLFKLSTYAYTEGMYRKPRIDDALLQQYGKNLAVTSGCLGSRTSQLILKNRTRDAEELLRYHGEMFKGRFFVELQLHEGEQQTVNKELIKMADRLSLPLLLTNDCHYTSEEDKQLHEIALCMQTNQKLSDEKRFSFGDIDVSIGSPEKMLRLAKQCGIPDEAITNTMHLAKMVDDKSYFQDIKNRYPVYPNTPEEETPWDYLEYLAKTKLVEMFGGMPPEEYRKRMNDELKIIKKMGFYDYLLIVKDFLDTARELNVLPGVGRGSAAGSLVMYALGITGVDPIKHNLLFSRFINEGRAGTPMIFDYKLKQQIESLDAGVTSVKRTHHHHGPECRH